MQRNLKQLDNHEFDIVIAGGGIYGAALAREAALRRLSAAVIDKGDFCCATSANSLKIIHGGLRYLQQADIIRVRESVRERRAMLRIAPHLISPLPCLMPTKGLFKSKAAMFAALLVNDILSADRNKGVTPGRHLSRGRIVSHSELESMMQGHHVCGSGAAVWNDAVSDNSERIVVEMVESAVDNGACAANYLELTGFVRKNGDVCGIKVHDAIGGADFEMRAKLVINAAGPWSNDVLKKLDGDAPPLPYALALGMNAVLTREIIPTYAAGLPCQEDGPDKGRLMFIMPWQGTTMGGTFYRHYTDSSIDAMNPTESDIQQLINQLNSALPSATITTDDISRIHAGLLPCRQGRAADSDPKLLRHYKLVDHARRDGIEGLITVLGVKYTTARDVAERTVTLAARKLGKSIRPSTSASVPLPGSINQPAANTNGYDASVQNAVRNEMAMTLSDVIYRRTDIGGKGAPDNSLLKTIAELTAKELGWNSEQTEREISLARNPLG